MDSEPNVTLGPLAIWVLGYERPNSTEYWDANWLFCEARVLGECSRVDLEGSFVHLSDIRDWKLKIDAFLANLTGVVQLETIEDRLGVLIESKSLNVGQLNCELKIRDSAGQERHTYRFRSDQSYLRIFSQGLADVQRCFPMKYEMTNNHPEPTAQAPRLI